MPQHWQAYPSRKRMRRLVAIHELPAMRFVLPAFVCSVGNRVVAMAVSLLGSRCSFIGAFMFCPPSGYPCGLAAAVATLLMTAGQPQETRSASGGGCRLWARSQWTKPADGDAAAHERKSPHGVNRAGFKNNLSQVGTNIP